MSIFYDKQKTKPIDFDNFEMDEHGFIILSEFKHYYCFDNVKIKLKSIRYLNMTHYTIRAHVYDNVLCIGGGKDIIQSFDNSIVVAQENAVVASHDNSTVIALDDTIIFNFEGHVLSYGNSRILEYPAPQNVQQ